MRVVLLPGMDGTGELFVEFMRSMPEPGSIQAIRYSQETAQSYLQLLPSVKAFVPECEPYFLLAESFSTPLAIQFAATKPPHLKGMILCAGFASSPLVGWKRALAVRLAPILFRLPFSSAAMTHFLIGEGASPPLKSALRNAILSVRPGVLAERLRAVLGCDAREALRQVAVPILYIQATGDRLIPKSCMEEIRKIQPDIRVARIDGPHLILQRDPQQAAQFVAGFIREAR